MKEVLCVLTLIFSFNCSLATSSKSPASLLEDHEPQLDQRYYRLLPEIKDQNAHIKLIRSRDPENMSLEKSFIRMIAKATNADTIVETGTYLGDSTEKMADLFKHVYTIELSNELHELAKKRFVQKKHVHLYQGDSAVVLPTIVKKLTGKTVFFLDAHFSMGKTAQGDENTPILTELEIIKQAGITDSIIIIDDLRMFYKPATHLKNTFADGYPTVQDVVEKILSINESYQCAIVYDTLIAFPETDHITVSPLVKALTVSRLYAPDNYAIEHVLMAELCIAQATGKEKEFLIDLCERWIEPWSAGSSISCHYALWYGLMLMEQEEYTKACAYFMDAKKRGMRHWRLDWYISMAQAQCFFDVR